MDNFHEEETMRAHGIKCPQEGFACDCCTNLGCSSNTSPEKEHDMHV